jgi:hypothetical protein
MCFSAEASFTSASLLAGIGYATTTQVTSKRQYCVASLPFVFMAMQLTEGFAWLAFKRGMESAFAIRFAAVFFLAISHVYWPVFPVLGTFLLEPHPRKRRILGAFLTLGCVISATLLFLDFTSPFPPVARVVDHSIQYDLHENDYFPSLAKYGPYLLLILILVPPVISSLPYTLILLSVTVGTFVIAQVLYRETCISVWCFFATGSSGVVYLMLHRMKRVGEHGGAIPRGATHESA